MPSSLTKWFTLGLSATQWNMLGACIRGAFGAPSHCPNLDAFAGEPRERPCTAEEPRRLAFALVQRRGLSIA
jgi:hypothetical protein